MTEMNEIENQIRIAAEWLAGEENPPRLAVPAMKEKFGLSAKHACEAIAKAQELRRNAIAGAAG